MLLITTVVSNQTMAYFAKRFNLNENVGLEVSFVCWIVLIFLHKCFSRHTSNKISKQYLSSEVNFFFLPGISHSKNDKQQLSYEMFLCTFKLFSLRGYGKLSAKVGRYKAYTKKKKSKNLNDKFTLTLGSQIIRSTIQSLFNGLLMFMNNAKLTCLQLYVRYSFFTGHRFTSCFDKRVNLILSNRKIFITHL